MSEFLDVKEELDSYQDEIDIPDIPALRSADGHKLRGSVKYFMERASA